MVKQINPGLARLYSSELTRTYGTNPGREIKVDSPGQQRVLEILEEGISDNQFPKLPALAATTDVEVAKLLSRLGDLVTHTTGLGGGLSQGDVDQRFAELMRLFLASASDPVETLRLRARSEVFIQEMSKPGLSILRGLSNAGFRRFHTMDQRRVIAGDTGAMGFPDELVGTARAQAVRQMISDVDVAQHSRVTTTLDKVSFAVLISNDVIKPEAYQLWLSRDIPHVAIVFTEVGAWVSHLVIPGVTPCLGCLEVARFESDPSWVATATQLSFLERDLADAASIFFAASIAIPRILDSLSGLPGSPEIVELDRNSMKIQTLALPKANCGCRLASSDRDLK